MGELPQIPTSEVGLGLASALLLFLAAYLLARARSERLPDSESALLRDRIIEPVFSTHTPDSTPRGLSFVGSLFLHLMVVAIVPSIQILSYDIPPITVPRYEIITLDYRMPLPPVVAAADVEPDPITTTEEPSLETETDETSEQAAALGAPEGGLAAPPRLEAPTPPGSGSAASQALPTPPDLGERATVRILLPDIFKTNSALRDIIIQPDSLTELPPDFKVDLPPVVLWAEAPPKLATGAVLEPVRREADAALRAALPDVVPQVSPPNQQPSLADLQIPDAPVLFEQARLTLPPADVIPLAGQNPLSDLAAPPSSFGESGQNSLIALSQQPDLQATQFQLQPGLRVGSIDSARPTEGTGLGTVGSEAGSAQEASNAADGNGASADATENGGGVGTGEGVTDSEGSGSSELVAAVRISGVGGTKIIELNGPGNGNAGSVGQSDRGLGEEGSGPGEGGVPDGEPDGDGRLRPLPRSQYGIILVSNNRSEIPEANGVLTGTPVYTVYIDVPESPRKWVLQYCVPEEKRQSGESTGVIRIKRVKRVDPPHVLVSQPLRLNLPPNNTAPASVVVYAKVDEEGNLADSRVIRGADPETDQLILANLQSWDFHPAFQHGEPVSVEAVFGIPLY